MQEDEMARLVERMEVKRNACRLLKAKHEGKSPLGRSRRRWCTILGSILERWDGVMWTAFSWLRIRTNGLLL
jgi:hypothetical protein